MSKVQDQILAQEETLSAQKEKRLNQFTRVKAAAQGVSLVVGGVIGAMALNPVALVTMVTKAYNLHETLKDSKNRNFADSRIVSRQRVDDVLSVLGPDVRPFEDTISKHFKDSELNHIVKKLDANELTVSDIHEVFRRKDPQLIDTIQNTLQELPEDQQYKLARCVIDRDRAALFVGLLKEAKQTRDAQHEMAKVQKEANKIAKKALTTKGLGNHQPHRNSFRANTSNARSF